MLLVLGCAVLLLFVVPCMLLGLGRMIEMATDGRVRALATGRDAARAGDGGTEQGAWFRQPMRPAFSNQRRPGRRVLRR